MPYILSLNCGSSSVKSKLFSIPADSSPPSASEHDLLSTLKLIATADAGNIGAKGKDVEIELSWVDKKDAGQTVKKKQDEVEYTDIIPIILDLLTKENKDNGPSLDKKELRYVTHRIVHGSTHTSPITVTKKHQEGLKEMEKLSEFAPLHNHNAVLAIQATIDALPESTSILLFDTLFHQTLGPEIYTYAVPDIGHKTPVPLRKYGFHGLSYASVLRSIANHLKQDQSDVNAVVCHLGSGGSVCMIQDGQSKDTSMGLTPLEGLVGGTRSGSIDPTLIFHHTPDCAENALDKSDGRFISKAEMVLNKQSGLTALAGTSDFGTITTRMTNPSSCSQEEHEASTLAYKVYLDRLLHFLSFYLFKLKAHSHQSGGSEPIIVFSGGIGEKGAALRADVMRSLGWMGVHYGDEELGRNKLNKGEGVKEITTNKAKGPRVFAVETDEEVQCALMARKELGV
ncbi:acetate kinase [Phaffia rhodozyma]|uniref:Probable acetate kinase n=1 Tax=Phaffia rhodozyma TaxID=264483 RepID=A0A0F7SQU2_PHARH|nr:acetate kinase [Phaffia rhodozyma]